MEKGPISFSKDGMKVSVKDVSREDYEDSTQRFEISLYYEAG